MIPMTVKQCDKDDFRLLTIDESAANDELMKMVVHSFLEAQHDLEKKNIEGMLDHVREAKGLSSWEICTCESHVCVLLKGQNCLSKLMQNQLWEQVDAELSEVDQDQIYLKVPM